VHADSANILRIATTTSVDNSGLLDYLLSEFNKDFPYEMKRTVVGSGKALRLGRGGEVDAVTLAIIALSHQLDMQTVAEGIETSRQMEFLKRINCNIGQGFLIARPMDRVHFEKWLVSHREHNTDIALWKQEEKL
jgi:hypothetical protein